MYPGSIGERWFVGFLVSNGEVVTPLGELEIVMKKRTPDSSSSRSSIGDHLDFELDGGECG